MTLDEYEQILERLAKENGLELTENAHNIARFRERTQLPMEECPCAVGAKGRGCIGPVCLEEIEKFGRCHCNCFCKKQQ